jgi:hypothetical protein
MIWNIGDDGKFFIHVDTATVKEALEKKIIDVQESNLMEGYVIAKIIRLCEQRFEKENKPLNPLFVEIACWLVSKEMDFQLSGGWGSYAPELVFFPSVWKHLGHGVSDSKDNEVYGRNYFDQRVSKALGETGCQFDFSESDWSKIEGWLKKGEAK